MIESLVMPLIRGLRTILRDVLSDLQGPAPDEDKANVLQAQAMLLTCVQILLKDINSRWGDRSDIMTNKEGPQRQLRGFCPGRVVSTAFDPQFKMFYDVPDTKHNDL